jgi:hypothetical protein
MNFLTRHNFFRLVFLLALIVASLHVATPRAVADEETRADAAHAGDTAKPLPFEPDEDLIYQADFSKLVVRGVEIAEFHFIATRAPAIPNPTDFAKQSGTPTTNLVFKSDVHARGLFRKLFNIDFHYSQESIVDSRNFLILRTTKHDEQGKRVRESVAEFNRQADRVTWTERNPNDANASPRVVTNPIRDAAHDIISAIYFLRTQPLAVGKSFDLAVSDSGQTYRVPVKVVERKMMKTVVGRVQTLRLDVGLFGEGHLVSDSNGEMTLWLTDDARHLPVRARLNMDIGTLDIKLKKVSGGIAGRK